MARIRGRRELYGSAVLHRVNPGDKYLDDYRSIIRGDLYDEIKSLAARLEGARILNVNATSFGGGVAELLYTVVPLMRDVGLDAAWAVMFGEEPSSTSPRASTMPYRVPSTI